MNETTGTAWDGLGRPGTAWDGLGRPGTAWDGLGRLLTLISAGVILRLVGLCFTVAAR